VNGHGPEGGRLLPLRSKRVAPISLEEGNTGPTNEVYDARREGAWLGPRRRGKIYNKTRQRLLKTPTNTGKKGTLPGVLKKGKIDLLLSAKKKTKIHNLGQPKGLPQASNTTKATFGTDWMLHRADGEKIRMLLEMGLTLSGERVPGDVSRRSHKGDTGKAGLMDRSERRRKVLTEDTSFTQNRKPPPERTGSVQQGCLFLHWSRRSFCMPTDALKR